MSLFSCPKCKSDNIEGSTCLECGIDTEQYDAQLAKQRAEDERRRIEVQQRITESRQDRKQANRFPLVGVLAAAIVVVSFLWLLMPGSDESNEAYQSSSSVDAASGSVDIDSRLAKVAPERGDPLAKLAKKTKTETKAKRSAQGALARKLADAYPFSNPIEEARNATVSIKTASGSGSGFIIDESCKVITNRHVVDTQVKLRDLQREPRFQQILSERQRSIQVRLDTAESELKKTSKRYGERNIKTIKVDERVTELKQELKSLPKQMFEEYKISTGQTSSDSSFEVSLINGSSYRVSWVDYSDEHDLALFSLPEQGCPFLIVGSDLTISQGTRLYAIGSPSGLNHTVTAGIFSGYRNEQGMSVLQVDVPINPGNSGGPLVTEDGRVVGVNTAILRGTEGIGFSLPISYVLDDFNLR